MPFLNGLDTHIIPLTIYISAYITYKTYRIYFLAFYLLKNIAVRKRDRTCRKINSFSVGNYPIMVRLTVLSGYNLTSDGGLAAGSELDPLKR